MKAWMWILGVCVVGVGVLVGLYFYNPWYLIYAAVGYAGALLTVYLVGKNNLSLIKKIFGV